MTASEARKVARRLMRAANEIDRLSQQDWTAAQGRRMNDDLKARAALRGCQAQLRAAYLDAHGAASHLTGARATRAGELADRQPCAGRLRAADLNRYRRFARRPPVGGRCMSADELGIALQISTYRLWAGCVRSCRG